MKADQWRDADFGAVSARPDDRRRRWPVGALLTAASVVVLLFSFGRDQSRCGQSCYGAAPSSRYGSITYEPGHPWTSYAGSWQWSAQNALAYLACLAAVVGLGLAVASRRNPVPAYLVAALAIAGWVAWVAMSPPVG
jgi:hypothetical protein